MKRSSTWWVIGEIQILKPQWDTFPELLKWFKTNNMKYWQGCGAVKTHTADGWVKTDTTSLEKLSDTVY